MRIGESKLPTDMDPLLFLRKFCEGFRGDDLSKVSAQLADASPGEEITVKRGEAFELLVHYCWSQSFSEEIAEKYAYLPIDQYVEFVSGAFASQGRKAKVVEKKTYLQDGYREHLEGRLDLMDENGNPLNYPDITGVIVLEKE